jgi:hypothetical protein
MLVLINKPAILWLEKQSKWTRAKEKTQIKITRMFLRCLNYTSVSYIYDGLYVGWKHLWNEKMQV